MSEAPWQELDQRALQIMTINWASELHHKDWGMYLGALWLPILLGWVILATGMGFF